jgi:cell division septation protein DedD
MPAPRAEANGPLSIVPDQGGAAPAAARVRTALARPTEFNSTERAEAAPSAGGGYTVQVTSQRSEAGAQAEFRALRAKFPSQLGGREPIIRRADLGAKGVYYRALVGPFASVDQAAGMCSSLKASGGTCIVQRD